MPIVLSFTAVVFGTLCAALVVTFGGSLLAAFLAYAVAGAIGLMGTAIALYARSKTRRDSAAPLAVSASTRGAPQQVAASGAS